MGDNPSKDFISLNQQGGHTIRVLTGEHRHAKAEAGFDAQYKINSLEELDSVLKGIFTS